MRDLNQPIVRSGPQQIQLQWRWCERVHHTAMRALLGIERLEHAEVRGHWSQRASQVAAEGPPVPPAITRLVHLVGRQVEDVGVDRREHHGHGPHPAQACIAQWIRGHVLDVA